MSSSAVRRGVPRDARGRTAWAVPLLLCAAILLVAGLAFNLAYLDTGGEQLPVAPGSGSPNPGATGILDSRAASAIVLAGFVTVATACFVLFFLRRKQGIPVKPILQPATWMDLVAMLIVFAVFGLLIFAWPQAVTRSLGSGSTGTNGTAPRGNLTFVPSVSGIPLGVFLIAALAGSVAAIVIFLRLGEGLLLPPSAVRKAPRQQAAEAVQEAIDQLQIGGDVREAILACYARFCDLLGARGILSQEALTPRELEDLAVHRLAVPGESSDALTGLFEEARYSDHALGEGDRDRAVRSLERIRADLEA